MGKMPLRKQLHKMYKYEHTMGMISLPLGINYP